MTPPSQAVASPPIDRVAQWGADYGGGKGIIDASQGVSGANPPPFAKLDTSILSHYGSRRGAIGLRTALCHDLRVEYATSGIHPDDIVITAGCNEAFCLAVGPLLGQGSRIGLLTPFYFNHDMWLRLHGLEPVYIQVSPNGGLVDQDGLWDKPLAAIVGVSPGNPTGIELSGETIDTLGAACRSNGAVLILDETYCAFRKNAGEPAHTIFESDTWRDYFISLRSLSKEFSVPGHRVGALVGGEAVIAQAMKWHDCISIAAPSLGQVFAEYALTDLREWRRSLAEVIRTRGTFLAAALADDPAFRIESWGGFFAWMTHPYVGLSDERAAQFLAARHGILTLPGSYFSTTETGRLRLSFAGLEDATTLDLVSRLRETGAHHATHMVP